MNARKLLMASFLALGAGAAIQAAQADELPKSIEQFAAKQQQIIMLQGQVAREEIRREIGRKLESHRTAFIESQMHDIESQGTVALAEIKRDLDLIQFEGVLARFIPRSGRPGGSEAMEMNEVKYHDR